MNHIAPLGLVHQRTSLRLIQGLALSVLLTLPTFADSIAPSSVSQSIATGGSVTIHKTVTITAGTPTSAQADIFFIADTTGSMGGAINNVKSSAGALLTALSAYGGSGAVQFGVAQYKDQGDAIPFNIDSPLGANNAATQAAINTWTADGGGDTPESWNNALKQVADLTAWRAGSQRFAIWFGDAPSHSDVGGAGSGVDAFSWTDARDSMLAHNVRGIAIDVGSMNTGGYANQLATATFGQYFSGISNSNVVSTIESAIGTAFASYSLVSLDTSEAPAGIAVNVVPVSYSGSYDRSSDRVFDFDVTLTGVAPGVYDFNLYGTVDGGRVATESDHIVVGGAVPDAGSTVLLLAGGLGLLAAFRRRFLA